MLRFLSISVVVAIVATVLFMALNISLLVALGLDPVALKLFWLGATVVELGVFLRWFTRRYLAA